jgi:hypothetical protein
MAIALALLVSADPITNQQLSHVLQELSIAPDIAPGVFGKPAQTRVVLPSKAFRDARTISRNAACTSKEGNPCHLRRHSQTHG